MLPAPATTCLALLLAQASAQGVLGALLIAAVALQQRLGGAAVAAAASWPANLAGHGRCSRWINCLLPALSSRMPCPAGSTVGRLRGGIAQALCGPSLRPIPLSIVSTNGFTRSVAPHSQGSAHTARSSAGGMVRAAQPLLHASTAPAVDQQHGQVDHGAARECPPLSRVPHALQAAVAGRNPLHEPLLAHDNADGALRGPPQPWPSTAAPPSGACAAAALPPSAGAWECVVSSGCATMLASLLMHWASRPTL